MMTGEVTIGILALQGAFDLHAKALSRLGVTHRLVKTAADLNQLDGLIIPGGESTTMRWLMDAEGMTAEFAQLVRQCMAKNPANRPHSMSDFLEEFRRGRVFRVLPRAPEPPTS